MQRSFMLSVSALVMIYAGNAAADSSHLKGTFGFTGSDACLYASGGFNARLQALGTTFSASDAAEGIRTFNGNGTGTFTSHTTTTTVPPTVGFLPSAGSSQSSASFTYTVADDTFTSENVPGTNTGTVLTGPRAGQTFHVEGVPKATGLISANGHTLVTSILTPGVETITYSNGDVEHRICHRSRVYIKLDND
ncbi:MAG TPA: hypothetical protein VKP67_08425 [Xanthobacteraceae bacterium]|nr:hypothetical protein [Xanthobacteraceae bacterium]